MKEVNDYSIEEDDLTAYISRFFSFLVFDMMTIRKSILKQNKLKQIDEYMALPGKQGFLFQMGQVVGVFRLSNILILRELIGALEASTSAPSKTYPGRKSLAS
uniref:Uncharacterized protein n=1 Tax=Glossina palpalis gambiensis TaxID=67801 RepID=A0A1B0AUY4_9MUSC